MNLQLAQAAAVEAARSAGAVMRRNLTAAKKVNQLTAHDIKLELDVRCQNIIERKLHRAFPEIAFLGEEGTERPSTAPHRWVVDPIDGTVNFAYGLPHSAVSIGLQKRVSGFESRVSSHVPKYETILGVVYDPFMNELWTALRGRPARLNGKAIHVSRRRSLRESMVSIGFAKDRASLKRALPYFIWLTKRVRKVRIMGSAALALTWVATGRLDAYVERGLNVWDIAAGGLIVECAGGKFWREPAEGAHRYRIIASNGLLHRHLPRPR